MAKGRKMPIKRSKNKQGKRPTKFKALSLPKHKIRLVREA